MLFFTAPFIYTGHTILESKIIGTDDQGTILKIGSRDEFPENSPIQSINGFIMPGMVNVHCHLELSHMKSLIPTGTGLVEFIRQIVTKRNAPMDSIQKAISHAVTDMIEEGIVAVGDISNVIDSFGEKERERLCYHTFVESFDLMQNQNTFAEFEKSKKVFDVLNNSPKNKKSIVPHAPYSVSDTLFGLIRESRDIKFTTSIHHQETIEENSFISERKGALVDFFEGFGLSLQGYKPTGLLASQRVIDHMASDQKTIVVHNTMSDAHDLVKINGWNKNVYWATCPNANLYIENKLPQYKTWLEHGAKICIGTDSLASNWQLSILEEMKTIQKYQSFISTFDLVTWACVHGAEALGFDDQLGSIDIGKKPGLVAIENIDEKNSTLTDKSCAKRLI